MALGIFDDKYLFDIADALREKVGDEFISDRFDINSYASGGTFTTIMTPNDSGEMYCWISVSNNVTGEEYCICNIQTGFSTEYTATIPPLDNISDWNLMTEIDYIGSSSTYRKRNFAPDEMPAAIRSIEINPPVTPSTKNLVRVSFMEIYAEEYAFIGDFYNSSGELICSGHITDIWGSDVYVEDGSFVTCYSNGSLYTNGQQVFQKSLFVTDDTGSQQTAGEIIVARVDGSQYASFDVGCYPPY